MNFTLKPTCLSLLTYIAYSCPDFDSRGGEGGGEGACEGVSATSETWSDSWLHNNPTTENSWAQQPRRWCLMENVFKKGQNTTWR